MGQPDHSGGQCSPRGVALEMTKNQQTLDTFYDGFGGGWGWRRFGGGGFGDATTTTENYKVGTLVVDLFDANTKKLLWRGSPSDTLSSNSTKTSGNLTRVHRRCLTISLRARSDNYTRRRLSSQVVRQPGDLFMARESV